MNVKYDRRFIVRKSGKWEYERWWTLVPYDLRYLIITWQKCLVTLLESNQPNTNFIIFIWKVFQILIFECCVFKEILLKDVISKFQICLMYKESFIDLTWNSFYNFVIYYGCVQSKGVQDKIMNAHFAFPKKSFAGHTF